MNNFISEWRTSLFLRSGFRQLAKLQKILFSCYFKKNYFSNRSSDEKKVHYQKQCVSRLMRKSEFVFDKLEHLYEIIFSIHQLRYRIKDYSTLEICASELKKIEQASIILLKKLAAKKSISSEGVALTDAIHSFEQIYNTVLRVVAQDPIVFLFFIQDLYAFQEEINLLSMTKK